jgi:hypothetical protein
MYGCAEMVGLLAESAMNWAEERILRRARRRGVAILEKGVSDQRRGGNTESGFGNATVWRTSIMTLSCFVFRDEEDEDEKVELRRSD